MDSILTSGCPEAGLSVEHVESRPPTRFLTYPTEKNYLELQRVSYKGYLLSFSRVESSLSTFFASVCRGEGGLHETCLYKANMKLFPALG